MADEGNRSLKACISFLIKNICHRVFIYKNVSIVQSLLLIKNIGPKQLVSKKNKKERKYLTNKKIIQGLCIRIVVLV